jgi:threonyl-tRNA synthetase
VAAIQITVDDVSRQVPEATTGTTVFADDHDVVAVKINGEVRDLATPLADGDAVAGVALSSPEGLAVLRHSTTHVLAQAVQRIRPEAKLGIGPAIENGFYYDFDVEVPFTPDDLKAITAEMRKIVKSGQRFVRRTVTEAEARAELADQPYKLELIGRKGHPGSEHGEDVEVGGPELTMYDNVDRSTGETVWSDLCRGPHLPNTKLIGNGFALQRTAAAYWLGDERNPQLQRVYGTAWATKDDLKRHLDLLAEAAKRDHRKLGAELDLFSFPDEIGSGLVVFHPRGGTIRRVMEDYSRREHEKAGYQFVYTPHITKGKLFETSGHLSWYKDGMFPPLHVDEEHYPDGTLRHEGQDYYLKPMNCPMHSLIYKSQGRSYRDLPMRLFEFGTVYRYEKSGVVQGLTRARGFTQDDSHIYTTREQMKDELTRVLQFVLKLLSDYGLNDFYLELSTKDPKKYVGSDEIWEESTRTLAEVAAASGLELVPDPEGAAFYGPKISVQARDAIGRTWQMSTLQLDFNTPHRFGLEYTAADGSKQEPVMIHRALFGSVERFFGVLLEHYAGAFPFWLSPEQAVGVPVAAEYAPYLQQVAERMRAAGVRATTDTGEDRMQKKIRTQAKLHVPVIMIAGEQDATAGSVSFRFRDGSQRNGIPVDDAIAALQRLDASHAQINSADDYDATLA